MRSTAEAICFHMAEGAVRVAYLMQTTHHVFTLRQALAFFGFPACDFCFDLVRPTGDRLQKQRLILNLHSNSE